MADYVTNFEIDNGDGVIKNVLIRENFIDVCQEGIKNNGSDITDSLNTLITKYKKSGVTLYFRAGTYAISNKITFDTSKGTSLYFDNGAIIKVLSNINTAVKITGLDDSTYRSYIHGLNVDGNNLCSVCCEISQTAQNIIFDTILLEHFKETGLLISATNSNHLFFNNLKIYADNDFETTALVENSTDNFYSNLSIQSIKGINLNGTGGHKFSNVHLWSKNDITLSDFNKSVGILNCGPCVWSNLYIDTYNIGFNEGIQNINGLVLYWYESDNIKNSSPVGIVSSVSFCNINGLSFNNVNVPNAKAVSLPNSSYSIANWINESRLRIGGYRYRESPFGDMCYSNCSINYAYFDVGSKNTTRLIGAVSTLARSFKITITSRSQLEEFYCHIDGNTLVVDRSTGLPQNEIFYGSIVSINNNNFLQIGVRNLSNLSFVVSVEGNLFVYSHDGTTLSGTSCGNRNINLTLNTGYSGNLRIDNYFDHFTMNGFVKNDSASSETISNYTIKGNNQATVVDLSSDIPYYLVKRKTGFNISPLLPTGNGLYIQNRYFDY